MGGDRSQYGREWKGGFLIKWKIQSKILIDKRERKRERGDGIIKRPMPLDSLSCRLYNWLHTFLGGLIFFIFIWFHVFLFRIRTASLE